jgi:hypothetical protein
MMSLLLAVSGCKGKKKAFTPAFYYWKTAFRLDTAEQNALKETRAGKLYVRLCDVGWDSRRNAPVPHDALLPGGVIPAGVKPVPVIFLEQEVLGHLSSEALVDSLAANMGRYVAAVCGNAGWKAEELQIDCDWTTGTDSVYFDLLRRIRAQPFLQGKILSATIRLHQVKYLSRSGVPPADRGMLMCYNMGNTKNPQAHNSILDVAEAKDYLKNLHAYTLPLDLALPLFRWCLWYRGQRLVGILRDVEPEDCSRLPFLRQERGNLYRCIRNADWGGYPLRAGDLIRAEAPSQDDVEEVASYAADRLSNDTFTVAFYHLDRLPLKKFPPHALEAILDRCR